MTVKQKILKIVYPLWMWFNKLTGKRSKIMENENQNINPASSIYDLSITLNSGEVIPLSSYRGKKMLIVNTASNCGYTNQYDDLQKLYTQYNQNLIVIGFPANDFREQEKGTDEEIEQFCRVNFGVSFPIVKKSSVIKTEHQNPVFGWLSHKNKNGWNDQEPTWNFSKYLIDESGKLIGYFDPGVSPQNDEIIKAISQ